ncbi:hypothetical protein [Catelliglobosispora koreensis]|uniref:hypothetical protein n=1 Tax=Catelliglobosispora koreensis TaxID=129052 RepID=UPI000382BF3F|nr:hypothetical protein [Catelliglobosispora koreensis]
MKRTSRILARLAAVAFLASAGVATAAPAQAASLSVWLGCESLGRYSVFCERTISGGVAPFTTKWYYNNTHFPSQDNKAYTSWGCTVGYPNVYKVVVTDATGASVPVSRNVICRSGLP